MEGTNFNRIEGAAADRARLAEELRAAAEAPVPGAWNEKTEREKEIVSRTLAAVEAVASLYGAERRNLTEDRIALVDPGGTEMLTAGDFRTGMTAGKHLVAVADRQESPLILAAVVAHEAIHLRAYRSAVALPDGQDRPLRIGIHGGRHGDEAVERLNETVTEELTALALEAIDDPELAAELRAQHRLRALAVEAAQLAGQQQKMLGALGAAKFPEPRHILEEYDNLPGSRAERLRELWKILSDASAAIDLLTPNAPDRYYFRRLCQRLAQKTGESDAEVFAHFARTYFGSASAADLVRYVDGALGKGAFKQWCA